MSEPFFIETVKIVNGKFIASPIHWERMRNTIQEAYGTMPAVFFPAEGLIPENKRKGIVKCRIEYDRQIRRIDFEPYQPRLIQSLKLVDGKEVDYHLKYADRTPLTNLLIHKGACDDILIVQKGKITDTSYSNVLLFDGTNYFTPSTCLLNGIKRQQLIKKGVAKITNIAVGDLKNFKRLYLINAMLDIEDNVSLNIDHIMF